MIYSAGLGGTMEVVSTILGFTMLLWPIDLTLILMKKYKVAVAIDIEDDAYKNQQKTEYMQSVEQVAQEFSFDSQKEEKEEKNVLETEENALSQQKSMKKKKIQQGDSAENSSQNEDGSLNETQTAILPQKEETQTPSEGE